MVPFTTEGHSLCSIVAAYIVSLLSVCFIFITSCVCFILSKTSCLEDSRITYFMKKGQIISQMFCLIIYLYIFIEFITRDVLYEVTYYMAVKNKRKVLLFRPTLFILAKMLRFFCCVPFNRALFICEILILL
jgi:hypothetical protein